MPAPREGRRSLRAPVRVLFACATMLASLAAAGAWPQAQGASSSVNVSFNVASATTLDPSGCSTNTPDVTAFGTVQPGLPYATGTDCALTFGSTNDSSMLRLYQQDGGGGAMVPGPTSNVVAWWPLNGNGNDLAPAPTTLSLTGGSFTPTGPTGYDQARTTSAAGSSTIASWKAAYDLQSFTIDLWFRGTVTPGYHYLLAKRNSAADINYGIWYDEAQTSINVVANTGGTLRYTNGIDSTALLNGAWHHLAMVSSGSSLSLYVDGQHVDTRAYPGSITVNNAPVSIGSGPSGSWEFPGDIDEVRIQSVPRGAAEIKTYFQAALPNYQDGTTDFGSAGGTFGACLRAVGAGVSPTWTVNAGCPATSGTYWNAIPATTGAAGAKVAEAAAPGSAYTAALRFGVRTASTTLPGSYVAPVVLEVLAPTA